MNNIDKYLQEQLLLAKVYENAETYVSSDGKQTMKISDLNPSNIELLEIKEIPINDGTVETIGKFQIWLPNGEKEILTVNNDGEDMAVDFVDDDEISQKFMLTPRMKKEIFKYEIEANVPTEEVENALFPNSPEELEKQIAEDTLIPKSEEETIKKIKENNPDLQVQEINKEEEENELDKEKETKEISDETPGEEKEEKEEEKVEIPENVRDKVEEIKEREGASLKHVLIAKNPSSISSQLIDTAGLQDNGGPVYCLAFSNGDLSSGNDRVVFVQGERVIDERRYDEDATNMMNDYRQSSVVENATDKDSKVFYTDIDGNTTVADLVARPKDLRRQDKDILAEKLNDLENKQKGILNSTNLTADEKIEKFKEINHERIKLLDEYGLDMPNIRSEISADIEMQEEARERAEEESKKQEETEEERNDENDDDEIDPRDPFSKYINGRE